MPEFVFQTSRAATIGTTTFAGIVIPTMAPTSTGVVVRRPGPDPTRDGRRCPPLPFGIVTTESVPMAALTEVFGVKADARWSDGKDAENACTLQVTLDLGTTYLAWDGAAWSEQLEDGVYNSIEEFSEHCATLPLLNPRSLGFRVRVTTTRFDTPELRGVSAYVEWDYAPMLDFDLFTKDLLERVRFPLRVQTKLQVAASRVRPQSAFTIDWTKPVRAYNLTTDPLMNVDLFSAVDGADVVLTAQQAKDAWIQTRFFGKSDVFVAHQDEMLTVTKVPSLIARIGSPVRVEGHMTGHLFDYKRGVTSRRVRSRMHGELVSVPLEIRMVVAEPRAAREALEAVRDALRDETLRSPSSGMLFTVVDDDPGQDIPNLGEGVDVARWTGHVLCLFPTRQYEEFEGVREVDVDLGSQGHSWEVKKYP